MQKSGAGVGAQAPAAAAVPTGCYKCGRPGHWSRDCPSSSSSTNPHPSHNPFSSSSKPSSFSDSSKFSQQPHSWKSPSAAKPAAKKAPRTRPKLTPDLLLSDDGLGYVLRHFPRAFKYRGRGHEFVHKVEKIGATKRVRRCISELKDRVARGGDPTKLHEPPIELVAPETEPECAATGEPVPDAVDPPPESHDVDDLQEEIFLEMNKKANEEPSQPVQQEAHRASDSQAVSAVNAQNGITEQSSQQAAINSESMIKKVQITEEQRARMEANRLKALERAAARAQASQAS